LGRVNVKRTKGGQIVLDYGDGFDRSVKAPQSSFGIHRNEPGRVALYVDGRLLFERSLPEVYILRTDRDETAYVQLTAANWDDLTDDINGKGAGGGGGQEMIIRTARVVIGSTGSGYTEKDCDFLCDGTDDLAQFNAAVAGMPAAGGEIKVLDGEYVFASPLVLSVSKVRLSGCGKSNTTLRMTGVRNASADASNAQSSNAVIFVSGSNNVIEGFALATPNTSGISYGIYLAGGNNTVTGNTCANSNSGYENCYGMYFSGSNNTITGNTCSNIGNNSISYGIYLGGSNNTVTGNTCSNNNGSYGVGGSYGIYLTGGDNNMVTGNKCSNSNTGGGGYGIYLGGSNSMVTGNVCSNSGGSGSGVSNSNISYGIYLAGSNNAMLGNMCSNSINIGSSGGGSGSSCYGIYFSGSNNVVTGNMCSNKKTGYYGSNCYGIYLSSGDNNAITGNTCSNSNGNSGSYGIYLTGGSNNAVTGNMCSNSGGVSYGIYLTGNNNTVSFVAAGKTASFSGFALHIPGTGNGYNQIVNCNLRNWAQYGTGVLTADGSSAATLPGSSTTVGDFSAIGTGSVAGLNMV
jgi:parallel beta-helix repeat protein